MGHVGDIGGRGRGRWSGEGTRIGPAPTGEGTRVGQTPQGQGQGVVGGGGEGVDLGGAGETLPFAQPGAHGRGHTGERPAIPARAQSTTGSHPVFNPERPSTTGSRPSLPPEPRPAATFADALTRDTGTRRATSPETLVMPKVEVPEPPPMTRGGKGTREMPALRDGRTATSPETSLEAREGRTVSPMDTPIGRGGGTRIFRMPESSNGKGNAEKAGDTPDVGGKEPGGPKASSQGASRSFETRGKTKAPELPPEPDGFRTTQQASNLPALRRSAVRGPVLPIKDLVPKGLDDLPNREGVAKRFASDAALLHQQVRPSSLPSSERAQRLWAFFAAYAEAAAAHQASAQGGETFDKALKEQGFAELRDAHTGEDGLKKAKWVLESPNPQEAKQRSEQVHMEPPPEVLLSEAALLQQQAEAQQAQKPEDPQAPRPEEQPHAGKSEEPQQARKSEEPQQARKPEEQHKPASAQDKKDSAFTQASTQPSEHPALERKEGHADFRVSPQVAEAPRPVLVPTAPEREKRGPLDQLSPELERLGGNLKKLGGNMLWNVLHRFRNSPEESALEKEKYSQVAFAAILAFVGLMLMVILLVAL